MHLQILENGSALCTILEKVQPCAPLDFGKMVWLRKVCEQKLTSVLGYTNKVQPGNTPNQIQNINRLCLVINLISSLLSVEILFLESMCTKNCPLHLDVLIECGPATNQILNFENRKQHYQRE